MDVINVTVVQGGTIDADLTGATVIETTVVAGGQIAAEVTGGGTGPQGPTGATGATGPQGPKGDTGGVPDGGTVSQILRKLSGTDQDTGWHTPVKADVGLGNVDNTSDANKPVSTAQATAIGVVQSDINAHEANTSNPHSVTKTQVGLANVDNVQQQPIDSDLTAIAGLDSSTAGAIASDGAGWIKKTYAQLKTALGLVKADVGLGNVDNTSDANKPVSTATQTALDGKVDENAGITGATKTKITYDAKGLVTAGADATQDDIGDGTTYKQYSQTEKTKLAGIETAADVTDAANVGAAGAFMKSVDDTDDITEGATNKWFTAAEETKLAGIEALADVTDAANVDSAGATMNSDTTLAGNGYFLDEDNMASNSAVKAASQQSIKAYVDAQIAGGGGTVDTIVPGTNIDVDATDPANPIVSVEALTPADIGLAATVAELDYVDGVTSAIQTQIDGKQALDSDLTSWAAITRAAGFDTFVATPSGANLAALMTSALPASKGGTGLTALAANIVSLLGAADYAAVRTLLGLVIGTNVQAYDADLTTLASAFIPASASGAASLDFAEDTDNGSNRVRLIGAASTADVTVTLPAATDTLMGKATTDVMTGKTFAMNGAGNVLSNPYKFHAYRNAAQNAGNGAFAIINFDTELYDTNNNFDVTTNVGRYTAPVAGFYQFNARFSAAAGANTIIALYKNGAVYQRGAHMTGAGTNGPVYSNLVQAAANDYFEIFSFAGGGALEVGGSGLSTYFSGHLVSHT